MPFASFNYRYFIRYELAVGLLIVFLSSCAELKRPETTPYLAETQPPPKQEFRWSNGGLPKSFDPARASAAPETDVVRAVFEGLTVLDPKTLEAKPGVAEEWAVSNDDRTWTFKLREDARWSNGKTITAGNFVRSLQRLYDLGDRAAHRDLLRNFAITSGKEKPTAKPAQPEDFVEPSQLEEPSPQPDSDNRPPPGDLKVPVEDRQVRLSVSAPDVHTLVIELNAPDPHFPELVAHPIFCPVYGDGGVFENEKLSNRVVTNGAFRIAEITLEGITLERSKTYWDRENVKLDVVRFISNAKPDDALEAYRSGAIDAVTNTEFSPLVQKLFSPYGDFRKNAFAALNFYEINYRKTPFNDRRVREALAISIERERLMSAELEPTAQPALSFLPFAAARQTKLVQDKERARDLLEQAGFENGRGFPVIKLTVNRNEMQLRIARVIAKMWKDTLNLETEVVARETAEITAMGEAHDFDIVRRGVVLPVPDEYACISAILGEDPRLQPGSADPFVNTQANTNSNVRLSESARFANSNSNSNDQKNAVQRATLTEDDALYQLRVIPLYFPTSFALVKPYVMGFDTNSMEIVDLRELAINNEWQPNQR